MIDYANLRLMHFHGDEAVALDEVATPHHDAAAHDIERRVGWFRRVYRCTTCDEEVIVELPLAASGGDRPAGDERPTEVPPV